MADVQLGIALTFPRFRVTYTYATGSDASARVKVRIAPFAVE